jgi:hypothetical protein
MIAGTDTAVMSDCDLTYSLRILSAALEDLRFMSRLADLGTPARRAELFGLADLVHNIPDWLAGRRSESIDEFLDMHASHPAARAWLDRHPRHDAALDQTAQEHARMTREGYLAGLRPGTA